MAHLDAPRGHATIGSLSAVLSSRRIQPAPGGVGPELRLCPLSGGFFRQMSLALRLLAHHPPGSALDADTGDKPHGEQSVPCSWSQVSAEVHGNEECAQLNCQGPEA